MLIIIRPSKGYNLLRLLQQWQGRRFHGPPNTQVRKTYPKVLGRVLTYRGPASRVAQNVSLCHSDDSWATTYACTSPIRNAKVTVRIGRNLIRKVPQAPGRARTNYVEVAEGFGNPDEAPWNSQVGSESGPLVRIPYKEGGLGTSAKCKSA